MFRGIGHLVGEVRSVLDDDVETMLVGSTVFIDRPLTLEEKKTLQQRLSPRRMKNLVERDEARIEL